MKHVVNFSGGKDSTAMLLMMLERNMPIDVILNVDTTKEFPQMYEHIEKVKEYIKPLKITTISFDFDYYMFDHIKTKGKNKGERGAGWPRPSLRWCTGLKRDLGIREANKIHDPYISYIGIAFNERQRANNTTQKRLPRRAQVQYPLVDWQITEAEALQYCYDHGFDWGGLYKKFQRVSCWCCPLSRIGELRTLYFEFPELWKQLEDMDSRAKDDFRYQMPVAKLTARFLQEQQEQQGSGYA